MDVNKKNVLHLVEYLYLGGIERLLEQFSIHTGEKANLLFYTYETEQLAGIGKQILDKGFPVYTYKKSAGRDWNLIKDLIRVIKEQKIDVIHTHDFGPVEYAVILKIRFPWIKLIHTQHTIINFIRHRKYTLFFQGASYFYNKVIAVSEFVAEIFKEHCPYMKKGALIVVSNGVDVEHFKTMPVDKINGELKLVSVARISKEKNLMYLLRTCKLLKDAQIPFQFHHAGTAKFPELIQEMETYINENNLSENIVLHGFTNDTLSLLRTNDIFITASHTEGHPVAVLEAMSCEKLCVCSDIKAHKELGEDVVVLFDKEDEKALFNRLTQVYFKLGDVAVDSRLRIGRNRVESKFSIQKMVDNYVNMYA